MTSGEEAAIGELLDDFARLRQQNLAVLEKLLGDGRVLSDADTHPELDRISAAELIASWVVHDPFFRFFSRFVFGHESTAREFLESLDDHMRRRDE